MFISVGGKEEGEMCIPGVYFRQYLPASQKVGKARGREAENFSTRFSLFLLLFTSKTHQHPDSQIRAEILTCGISTFVCCLKTLFRQGGDHMGIVTAARVT